MLWCRRRWCRMGAERLSIYNCWRASPIQSNNTHQQKSCRKNWMGQLLLLLLHTVCLIDKLIAITVVIAMLNTGSLIALSFNHYPPFNNGWSVSVSTITKNREQWNSHCWIGLIRSQTSPNTGKLPRLIIIALWISCREHCAAVKFLFDRREEIPAAERRGKETAEKLYQFYCQKVGTDTPVSWSSFQEYYYVERLLQPCVLKQLTKLFSTNTSDCRWLFFKFKFGSWSHWRFDY